jgi:hypothetical protein
MIHPSRFLTLLTVILAGAAIPVAAQQQARSPAARAVPKAVVRASALATVQVSALDSVNAALPNALVRLRDVMYGRIVGSSVTDQGGIYSFKGLDPGSYIVELVSETQTALAATNLINANAGELVKATVKMPFRPGLIGGLIGGNGSTATGGVLGIGSQIKAQLPQAALQGVAAVVPVGTPISER